MADGFDSTKIEAAGWRQGAVLCEEVAKAAIQAAPQHIQFQDEDWPNKKEEIEDDIIKFWSQFEPCIKCGRVDALGTDEIM